MDDLNELNAADRGVIRTALTNHADALAKEAKKVGQLGHAGMADRLATEAEMIVERLRPAFDEQHSLAIG